MNENVRKLFANAKVDNGWREKVKWRHENRHWLKHSANIAIAVLIEIRKQGTSKEAVAKKIGISEGRMLLLVKGQYNIPLKTICALEEVLGIELLSTSKDEKAKLVDHDEEAEGFIKLLDDPQKNPIAMAIMEGVYVMRWTKNKKGESTGLQAVLTVKESGQAVVDVLEELDKAGYKIIKK